MVKAFPNRCITPQLLSRGSRARRLRQYLPLLLFGVLAGSAVAETDVSPPLTYNDGDLFLGFRATDRTKDYLINIGPPTQFVNAAPGSTFQVDVGNTSADLVTAFSSDWYTRIDVNTGRNAVLWAVTGGRVLMASGDPDNTLYSTNPISMPWSRRSDTAQSFTTSLIATMANTFAGNPPTANNPRGLIQNATSSNSYASFQPGGVNSGGISFQTWNPWNEGVPANGVFFNRIVPGSGSAAVLGSFTLNSSGQVTFTAAAAPTPTPSPTIAPTPTPTPVITPTPTTTPGTTPTPTGTPGITPTPTTTPGIIPTPTGTPEITPTITPTPTPGTTTTPTPTATPGATATPIGSPTATPMATPSPSPTPSTTLTTLGNISTRLRVETGDNALIGGFIVTGTQPKKVIVRAIGPSLSSFFPAALADPILELRNSSGGLIRSNDNWRSDQEAEILAASIPPNDDLEAAIVETLPANGSAYTVIIRGVSNGVGIAVVEAYDLDQTVDSTLANISTRGLVLMGDDAMIAGTIVLGPASQRVLVRAIGPSLPVEGNLADPFLELRDSNGNLIRANDNWRSDQEAEIMATTIPPTNNLESAIVETLPANGAAYTAIVRGVNGTSGIALVELYSLN